MADYDKDIEFSKAFRKDPKLSNILSDTSIDDKVTITKVHKNINSLAGQLEKSQLDMHKQIKGISSSLSSTAKQQQKIVQQIRMKELGSSKEVKVVEKSVQQILGKLGYTIDALGRGSKKILSDTVRTTKQTLQEYGQALRADFNINKGNFLAMTLAKASPIFGYFAGKFMETSIFKNFAEKIKEKLGMALTFVANKMRDLWGRGKEKVSGYFAQRKEKKEKQKELPKLQSGGYVTKAGAAKLHAAEVVAPIEKLETMFTKLFKPMNSSLEAMKDALNNVALYSKKIYDFMKWSAIFKMAKTVYRFLRRNKYSPFLSKSKDPQVKLVEDMGTFFSQSMAKYDEIITSLGGIPGRRGKPGKPGAPGGFQFGTLGDFDINAGKSKSERAKIFAKTLTTEFGKAFQEEFKKPKNMFDNIKGKLQKGKSWLKETKDIATEERLDFGYGPEFGGGELSKSQRLKKQLGFNKAKQKSEELQNKTLNFYKKSLESIKKTGVYQKVEEKYLTKIKKATEGTDEKLGLGRSMMKKAFSSIGTWLLVGLGLIKNTFGKIMSFVGPVFKVIGPVIGAIAKFPFKVIGGLLNFLVRKFPMIAGAISIGTMVKDALVGTVKAREWHGVKEGEKLSTSHRVTAAIGGALGGTESGVEGAKSGALKGAGLGMMIGTMIAPGLGTAIGGALGAIAGGLLGAVGGKNIAVGLKAIWDQVKSIVTGAWRLIKLPFKMMGLLAGRAKKWFGEKWQETKDFWRPKVEEAIEFVKIPFNWIGDLISDAKKYWGEKISKFTDYVNEKVGGFLEPLFQVIDPVVSFISEKFSGVAEALKSVVEFITSPIKSVKKWLSSLGDKAGKVVQAGKTVVAGDVKQREAAIAAIEKSGTDWARGGPAPPPKAAATAKAIETPASKGMGAMAKRAAATGAAIAAQAVEIGKATVEVAKPIAATTVDKTSEAAVSAKEAVTGAAEKVMTGVSGVVEKVKALPKEIKDRFLAVKSYITNAAEKTGMPLDILTQMAGIESGYDPNIKAKTSSATGLYQFITGTWRTMLNKHGSKYGFSPGTSPTDPSANALMGAEFLKENSKIVASVKQGQPVTATDLYLAHFLGGGGARKFLRGMSTNPGGPAYVGMESAAAANKSIFYDKGGRPRSFSEIYDLFTGRLRRFSLAAMGGGGVGAALADAAGLPQIAPEGGKTLSAKASEMASNVGASIAAKFNGLLALPTDSNLVTSEFGPRNTGLAGASKYHKGIDLRAAMGAPIYAMADGTVIGVNSTWGKISLKNKDGYISEYAHLSKMNVKPGDVVQKGQIIGLAGKTGPIPGMAPHLHHSIKAPDGSAVNPRAVYAAAGINLASKGGSVASNKEMGGPINSKDVVKIESARDLLTAFLLNGANEKFQNAALDSMKNSGNKNAIIIQNTLNNVSSSVQTLAKSLSSGGKGGGGNEQGNDMIEKILTGNLY